MSFNSFKSLISVYSDFRNDDNNDAFYTDNDRIILNNARSVLTKVYNETLHKDEESTTKFLEQEIAWAIEDHEDAKNKENPIKIAVTQINLETLLYLDYTLKM